MNRRFVLFVLIIISTAYQKTFSQPVASFTPSRYNICSGKDVILTNSSIGANSYNWFIDGIFYSNSVDTSATLYENCYDMKEIELIACDTISGSCDSTSHYVEVFDSCFFHWTGDFFNCPGDTISLASGNEAVATIWDIQPAHAYLTGCDTCPSVSFILQQNGTMVDRNVFYDGGCSDVTSFHYLCFSDIDEIEDKIKVYPNPFVDHIEVSITGKEIKRVSVYDSLGKLVMTSDSGNNYYDLGNLKSGIYFLQIETIGGFHPARTILVKQ